jgi:glycerophosphoryl diester phosphodiesterase
MKSRTLISRSSKPMIRSVRQLFPIVFLASIATLSAMEIIAHRGASADAPENTLAAFQLAWEQESDAIELDIHASKDGRIVTIHDPTTKRTASAKGKVVETPLTTLQKLDAGSWKGAKWKGEKIPTLEEVLATLPAGKRVFIEIKCGPEVLQELARVITASRCKPEQLDIIGFGYETMKQAKVALPKHKVFWITTPAKNSKGRKPGVEELIEKARAAGLDGLDLDYRFAIDKEFVSAVHKANMKLYVWTVDSPEVARRLRDAGVDGITTNRPGFLRAELSPAP